MRIASPLWLAMARAERHDPQDFNFKDSEP